MFAHEIILSKSGPLARIWLAAHWDKKLKKKDIFETKLIESVENIINPKMKLALRTSGHLLLGVVKIYSRKTGFLYTDCNEAIVKLRSAFRPGQQEVSNTTKENKTKGKAQQLFFAAELDLPDIDTPLPDLNDLDLDKNRARLEEITLREENDFLNADDLGLDGDQPYNSELAIDLDNEEMMRNLNEVFGDNQMDFGNEDTNLLIDDQNEMGMKTERDGDDQEMSVDPRSSQNDTTVHENPEQMLEDLQNPMSVAPSEFSQPPATPHRESVFSAPPTPYAQEDTVDDEPDSPPSRPPRTASFGSIQQPMTPMSQPMTPGPQPMPDQPPSPQVSQYHDPQTPQPRSPQSPQLPQHNNRPSMSVNSREPRMTLRERKEAAPNQPSYQVLESVDQMNQAGRRRKIRRQLIIDQQIGIDAETMRSQLRDHADICGALVMAPPVEKILRSKEETNPEKLFNLPISKIHIGLHQTCFASNCRTDLPACAILRQEEANVVESFDREEIGRRQSRQYIDHQSTLRQDQHDSDDDDMYSGYGPPSVASSYHPEQEQEMSHMDNHDLSQQDNQWAKAMGQPSTEMPYEQNMSMNPMSAQPLSVPPSPMAQRPLSVPSSPMPHSPMPQSPMPQHSMQQQPMLQQPSTPVPSPLMPQSPLQSAPSTPVYDQPIPSPAMSSAPPTPIPAPQTPESPLEDYSPRTPLQQEIQAPSPRADLNDSNYEPEPKRLRTESAEQELRDVEAGKGTAACIKYTQRLLQDNECVSLHQMTDGNHRKIAAQKFYSLLVMLKHEHINALQDAPYADIAISKGINFGGVIMDHC